MLCQSQSWPNATEESVQMLACMFLQTLNLTYNQILSVEVQIKKNPLQSERVSGY